MPEQVNGRNRTSRHSGGVLYTLTADARVSGGANRARITTA
jgi:hypothetical protein